MLALLASTPTLGIEVTEAELASACSLGNIDPQHGHDSGALLSPGAFPAGYVREGCMAAIDVACGCALPAVGATLATIRPDLDSVGSMAVLVLRALGLVDFAVPTSVSSAVWHRVCDISSADSYRPGPWAPRPLLTVHRLFNDDENAEPADGRRSIAHLGAICSPRQGQQAYALDVRVATMACWLLGGDAADLRPERANDPDADAHSTAREIGRACGVEGWSADKARMAITDARATVEASRLALAQELARPGAIDVQCLAAYTCEGGQHWDEASRSHYACTRPHLAIVRVSHAGALGAGYCLAPVAVAFDQAVPGKVTIATAEDGHVDFGRLKSALNEAEGMAAARHSPVMTSAPLPTGTTLHTLGAAIDAAVVERPDLSGWMVTRKMVVSGATLIEITTIGGFAPGGEIRSAPIPQWGGPRNLLGSPQGTGTRLSEAEIVGLVRAAMVAP
jgi:hypothetical protein